MCSAIVFDKVCSFVLARGDVFSYCLVFCRDQWHCQRFWFGGHRVNMSQLENRTCEISFGGHMPAVATPLS